MLANSNTITPVIDNGDTWTQVNTQAGGTLIVNAPVGTYVEGESLILRIKCTNQQTFSWNPIYRGSPSNTLPTATTGGSKTDYFAFLYNLTDVKFDFLSAVYGY